MGNRRIPDSMFDQFLDGNVLSAEDLNKIILVMKGGINSNKAYLDTLIGGNSELPIVESFLSLPDDAEDGDWGFVFVAEDLDEDGYEKKYTDVLWFVYKVSENAWCHPVNETPEEGLSINLSSLLGLLASVINGFKDDFDIEMIDWNDRVENFLSDYAVEQVAILSNTQTISAANMEIIKNKYDLLVVEFDFLQTGDVGRGAGYSIRMYNPSHTIRNIEKTFEYYAGNTNNSPRYGGTQLLKMEMYTDDTNQDYLIGSVSGRLFVESNGDVKCTIGSWNIVLANWDASMFSSFTPRLRVFGLWKKTE